MKRFSVTALLLAMTLQVLAPAPTARAEDSWQALPAETVFAVRVPNGQVVVDALKATKLGKVMFKQQRIDEVKKAMEEGDPDAWAKMQQQLARFDLKFEQLPNFLAGETGMAIVMAKQQAKAPGAEPKVTLLVWANPGEEMAAKFMKMIDAGMEDNKAKVKPKRVDFEIDGAAVTHLQVPETGMPALPDFPADFENMTPEEIQEFFRKRKEARENAKPEIVDQTNILMSRQGGRIIMAVGPPQNRAAVSKARAAGGQLDWNELTGVKETTAVFARFLADHKGGGEFVNLVNKAAGLGEAMPKGKGVIEVAGNIKPILALADAQQGGPPIGRVLRALGLDNTGVFGLKLSIDGNLMRSGMFIEAPAPRRGVLAVLDKSTVPAEVPAWVPANAMEYMHLGLDLGALYTTVKQIVLQEMGQQAAQGFNMIEFQVKNFAQADMATVLSSIGSQHTIVSYPPKMKKQEVGDEVIEVPDTRQAFVWQLKNEQVWKNLFGVIATFAGEAAQKVEEQGFTGYRINQGPMNMAIFMGKGYLTVTQGEGVSAEILKALGTPPAGEAAMRNTAGYQKARKMVNPKAGLSFQYSDMERYSESLLKIMKTAFDQAAELGGNDGEMFGLFSKLLPTGDEAKGIFGVGGGQIYMNDNGLVADSVMELPAE